MSHAEHFDVCIIGSGFAGSIIANELAATGKRIAIIEAGDREDKQASQLQLLNGRAPGFGTNPKLHTPISVHGNVDWRRGYSYNAGGHVYWTAWAPRPLPNHFKSRSLYGTSEDWPVGYDELEPDYCRAEEELGVSGDSNNQHSPPRSRPYPMEAFPFSYADQRLVAACKALGFGTEALPVARNRVPRHGRDACCFSGSCNFCPTTAKYRADLAHLPAALKSKNVTLFTQRVAVKLVAAADGKVDKLICLMPDRSEWTVSAGVFIVAANTIESTRLLLGSAQEGHPRGLGNKSGVMGRYLTDHTGAVFFGMSPEPLWAARTKPAVICRQFEDGAHRRDHAGFFIHFSEFGIEPPSSTALRLVDEGKLGAELSDAMQRAAGCTVLLDASMEIQARADNRVELDPSTRDALGRPSIKVTMEIGDYEKRGAAAAKAQMTPILQKMGCTTIFGPLPGFLTGFHSMGTMRMGKDPTQSVLDPELKMHDLANVYVASSASFPSSLGPCNPTLTLVALSLRLARHLRKEALQ